ncbi:hypothetical protein AWC38_SpisGene23241, partial [Stylophora pistillata]
WGDQCSRGSLHIVHQLPTRKSSREVIFITTSPPEEKAQLLKPMNEIEEVEDDSEDIHSTGLIKSSSSYQEHFLLLKEKLDKQMHQYAVCSEDMNDIEQHLHHTEVSDSQYDLVAPNAQSVELQDEGSSCMDISSEEDERTLTMIDPLYGDSFVSSQSNEDECVAGDEPGPQPEEQVVEGSKSVKKNKEKTLKKLEETFSQLTDVKDLKMSPPLDHELRPQGNVEMGTAKNGSSEVLGAKHNSDIYLNDNLLAAAIIISKVVIDMAVVDKRETGGNSVTMEKEGVRRLSEKMTTVLPFSEITTDASSSIIKIGVRNERYIDKFPQLELLHSLDIWHKAKKLSKCIHQAARVKGCESLKEWIDDVEVWFGVLHHVCGEHNWAEGECRHYPEETPSNGKTYLKKSSKALAALRKVVLDKKWLSNLAFYVRFRLHSEASLREDMCT